MTNEQNTGEPCEPEDTGGSEPFGYHHDQDAASPAEAVYQSFRETRIENRERNINEIVLQLDAQNARNRLLQHFEQGGFSSAAAPDNSAPSANGWFKWLQDAWQRGLGTDTADNERGVGNAGFSFGPLSSLGAVAVVAVLGIVAVPMFVFNGDDSSTNPLAFASTPQVPATLLASAAQGKPGERLHSLTRGSGGQAQAEARYFWLGRAVSELVLQIATPASGQMDRVGDLQNMSEQFEQTDLSTAISELLNTARQESPTFQLVDGLLSRLNLAIAQTTTGAKNDWWFRLGKSVVALEYSLVWSNDQALHDALNEFEKLFPLVDDAAVSSNLVDTLERLRVFVGSRDFEKDEHQTIVNTLKRVSRLLQQ